MLQCVGEWVSVWVGVGGCGWVWVGGFPTKTPPVCCPSPSLSAAPYLDLKPL